MKTRFKKLLAIALVLIMVLSAMPVSAAAEVGAKLIKSAPSVMDKVWSGWRNAWPGQLAGKIAGRPAQKLHNEAIDGALISVDAPNLALPEGTTVEVEKITDMEMIQSIIDNTPGMEAKAVNAYDITFRHNGVEVEPLYDVDVVLNASGNGEGKTVSLYHIDASAAELNSEMTCEKVENAEVSGSTVSFRAKAFSIYFVAEPAGTPKVKVNFEDDEGNVISTQRVSLADFNDYDGMPIYEPSIDNDEGTFTGWQIAGNGDAMLITDVNEYVYNHFDDIFGVGDSEITFTPTEVTLFFIIYMSGPANDPDTKVISTMPYVVNNGQVRFRVNDTFQKAGTKLESWSGSDNEDYTPGRTATLNVSSFVNTDELILYPEYIEGHWLIFDTNEDANDLANGFTTWAGYDSSIYTKPEDDPNVETSRAKLIAPIFVPDGQTPADVGMPRVFHPGEQWGPGAELVGNASDYYLNPESAAYNDFAVYRRGYVLDNWYKESAMTNAFNPNEQLEDDVTVYAKWSKGQSSVRILLYKEREDSPAFGNNNVAPTFDYFALYIAVEHLGNFTFTGNTYSDRSPERVYDNGLVIETGCTYDTVDKYAVDYCRTHEDSGNPMQNLFDLEYEYFYFEPDDPRYQKNIDTITHVRGDGTSTLEFYLRRCTYRVTLYQGLGNPSPSPASDSDWGGNYIFLGAKRNGANTTAPYETVAYKSGKWYYVECNGDMNTCCNSPMKFLPTKTLNVLSDYYSNPTKYRGSKLLEFYGLYYSDLQNYPKFPENMRLLEVTKGRAFPPYPTLYQLKAAEYDQAIYDATQYSRYGGFAPEKTYSEAITLYNYHYNNAAAVRLIETAACDGTYEIKDMEFRAAQSANPSVGIFNNLRGYFPSYYTIYTVDDGASYWRRAYNMDQRIQGGSTAGVTKLRTILFTDLYPDAWRDILLELEDYNYTYGDLDTNREIYDALVNVYGDEPLWNGPQTGASSWPEGAFVIKYYTDGTLKGRIQSVDFKPESDFHKEYPLAYVNYSYLEGTGNDQTWSWNIKNGTTAFNGTAVFLYHYARKAYPLTYTTPDSAGFGLEAEDNYVVYGLSVNEELTLRPTQYAAYLDKPGFTPAGKYFTGWYTNRECTEQFNADTKFTTSGKIAVAKYDPIKYRVLIHYGKDDHPDLKFNGSNNMPNPDQSTFLIEHGEKLDAALENVASLEGYSLVGWKVKDEPFNFASTRIGDNIADMSYGVATYSGKSGTDEFGRAFNDSNDESVQGIIDVYAVWGEDNFNDESIKIVYDAIYGEGTINGNVIVPDAHVYADGSIAFGRPAATADDGDMHFAYWELHKPNGSTVRVYPGQRFRVDASDAVPYQPGYDMTWSYKSADGSPLTATNKCLPGQRPTAPAGVPEGYVENGHYYAFQGWTPDPQNTIPEEAMTFTARYGAAQDIPEVTITLDYQSVQSNATATAAYGSTYNVPDVTLANDSPYYFRGWSKTADGDVAYYANDSITIDSTSPFTLYAVWASRVIYKDGYVGAPMADVITYTDYQASTYSPIGVTELEWEHSGYAFVGWTYNGTTVQPGDTISNPTYPITLTAQWLDGHNVIYHANNGTDATISQFVDYGQSFKFKTASELSGFSRTGYHMTEKLYENAECTGTYYNFDASHASISADLHVYVQWEADAITITFNPGSATGNTQDNRTAHYDDVWNGNEDILNNTFVAPNDNMHFVGWKLNTTNQQMTYPYTVTEDITLTAMWGNKDYHITFNDGGAGGGSMPNDVYRDYSESYALPACGFTKTDYDFAGWSVGGQVKAVGDTIEITDHTTITATWVESGFKPITLNSSTTFSNDKIYLIGCVSGNYIYLMSSDKETKYNTYRAVSKQSYDGNKLKITDSKLIWNLSGSASSFTIKSTEVGQWLVYSGSYTPTFSNTSFNWNLNGSKIKCNNSKGMQFVSQSGNTPAYITIGAASDFVILEKNATTTNILPAPESKLSAATKSEKAVKGNVEAPVVNTTKAAPEIVSRDVTPEPGEYVIYLTAVYVERIEDIDGTRIILDANGLTFIPTAKAEIESMNGNTIGWTDPDNAHKRIISDSVEFENGNASVKIPGPNVFAENGADGYRLIGWNTQPDGSGVEIHFSGITNDVGQYDAKFTSASENELQVYIDNLDKGNKNTRINTLYAMWEGYTAFYHSSNNTIEPNDNGPVKYPDNTVGGTLVYSTYAGVDTTVNIPSLVPTGYLYGGYYKDYDGKGEEYKFADISDVTDAVAYNGANANWYMDDENTGAYKERGDRFTVEKGDISKFIGKTLYIKEVPADKYLRPYTVYTYNRNDKVIRSWWLITDTDDKNYLQTGFIVGEEITPCFAWPSTVNVTPKNAGEGGGTKIDKSKFNTDRAFVPYVPYLEDESNPNAGRFEELENKSYTNYWITPDHILVIGTRERTFHGNLGSAASDVIRANVTTDDYNGPKYYYKETI